MPIRTGDRSDNGIGFLRFGFVRSALFTLVEGRGFTVSFSLATAVCALVETSALQAVEVWA